MTTLKVCSTCIIDSSVPGVFFDEQGVCNYCHLYHRIEKDWPLGKEGEEQLAKLVDQIKARGRGRTYDCVVGVSGGTDSSYLLYWAAKAGLRCLAVHFDNGWNSPIAVRNIKNAISKLGVDLETYVVDWEEYKEILVSFLKASFPWADAPTDLAIDATLYRIAARENVGFILNGSNFRTEGKMPREWTYMDGRILRYIQKTYGSKTVDSFPNITFLDYIYFVFFKGIRLVRPLNFMPYHKDQARSLLEKELGWEYYGGHHYENIYTRFVYSYLLPEKFHIDKRIITFSALIRADEITRAQAVSNYAEPPYPPDKIEEDVEYIRKKLDLSETEFQRIMQLPIKSFLDFPSYFPLIMKFAPVVRPLTKLFFSWTPPFFYEIDSRNTKPSAKSYR